MYRKQMLHRSLAAAVLAASAALAVPVAADVQVNDRTDRIKLTDGEEIECIILVAAPRALVVVEKATFRQRTIGRDEIASIERGRIEGRINGYITDAVGSRKEIIGEGFRREERRAPEEKTGQKAGGELEVMRRPRHLTDKSATRKALELMESYERHYPSIGCAIAAVVGIERLAETISVAAEDPVAAERYRDIAALLAAGDKGIETKSAPGPRKTRRAVQSGGTGAAPQDQPAPPGAPAGADPSNRQEQPSGSAVRPAGKSAPAPVP